MFREDVTQVTDPLDSSVQYSQTAILLIAHGSRRVEANQELVDLASRLIGSLDYSIIEPSYLELAEPGIVEAGGICVAKGASRVLMVPYFLSAGVHIRRDLAEARDQLTEKYPEVSFVLGPPLGPHQLLDDLVSQRIKELDSEINL